MPEIRLTGELVCRDDTERALVEGLLPAHVALTRAEPGCVAFEVNRIDGTFVWKVAERFRDAGAFHAHQARATSSEWGIRTAQIERHYTVDGL